MILRRIASAFRRQDWFTVFVETMIVVLGVNVRECRVIASAHYFNFAAPELPSEYPDLIQAEAAFDPQSKEVVSQFKCDLASMQQNQKFLNDLSSASDRNDAFLRDGLAVWSNEFDYVHGVVHQALGVVHEVERATP